MRKATLRAVTIPVLTLALMAACADDATGPGAAVETAGHAAGPASLAAATMSQATPVSGTGIFFTATSLVHSEEPTPGGLVQRSSVAGQLTGDLNGSVLFIPTAVFDFDAGTLVNTGTQFFSGTVAGSDPVILHDSDFRFDIDLGTGATLGTVHLSRSGDAPDPGHWFECDLVVVGTGVNADGDITSDYTGECVERGHPG
jgi:hypothetical protein